MKVTQGIVKKKLLKELKSLYGRGLYKRLSDDSNIGRETVRQFFVKPEKEQAAVEQAAWSLLADLQEEKRKKEEENKKKLELLEHETSLRN